MNCEWGLHTHFSDINTNSGFVQALISLVLQGGMEGERHALDNTQK